MKCDVCGHEHFRMFTNTKVKLDFYECLNCYARVGKHKNRDMPFGKFADAETRKLRMEAHKHFDALWKQKKNV